MNLPVQKEKGPVYMVSAKIKKPINIEFMGF
jgi:hypothetical protein